MKLKNTFAEIVSRVFDPIWEIPLAILLAVAVAMQEGLRWRFLGLLMFVDAIVPGIFFAIMLLNKQLSDWDMQKRQERIPLYFFTTVCHLGGVWLAYMMGKTELAQILGVYYCAAIIFALITLRWKISVHTGVNAALITSLNIFTGWKYWYLYLILVLVAWARIYQNHHSYRQAVVGAVLGALIVLVGLSWVGV